MRLTRIKTAPEEAEASYHCMSRAVNGDELFDDVAREMLRRQLWQVADYCGLQILTHTEMTSHFHVVLHVPKKAPLGDVELLRRYRVLHPQPSPYQAARLEVIEQALKTNTPEGEAWRKRQFAMMGDISPFMKLVKQRFSVWFNKSHERIGTLWTGRFTSVLLETQGAAPQQASAYVDLNSVSKSWVSDPKDYRFCGYSEAVAGHEKARQGICALMGEPEWSVAQLSYRKLLFSMGAVPRENRGRISPEDFQRTIAEGGKLPLGEILRCRVRYFTDGAVLGSKAFVQAQLTAYQLRTGRRKNAKPYVLPALTDWGDLAILRKLRGPAIT